MSMFDGVLPLISESCSGTHSTYHVGQLELSRRAQRPTLTATLLFTGHSGARQSVENKCSLDSYMHPTDHVLTVFTNSHAWPSRSSWHHQFDFGFGVLCFISGTASNESFFFSTQHVNVWGEPSRPYLPVTPPCVWSKDLRCRRLSLVHTIRPASKIKFNSLCETAAPI